MLRYLICPKIIRLTIACLSALFVAIPAAVSAPAQQTQPQASAEASTQASAPAAAAAGAVHTADGSPVPGATLRLVNTDTRKVFVSWTDESGKFEFPALPAGHYRVEASQLGFVPASLDLQLGGGPAPPPLQLVLRVATLAELAAPPESSAPSRPAGRRFGPGAGPGSGQGSGQGPGAPPAAASLALQTRPVQAHPAAAAEMADEVSSFLPAF